mmetsp:Transcript_108062/g.187503  ORF Transcript_108062/g.187503 Transcript_108062/m.187503 type:complete len:105 (+) Transcript_108062:109-423(+)
MARCMLPLCALPGKSTSKVRCLMLFLDTPDRRGACELAIIRLFLDGASICWLALAWVSLLPRVCEAPGATWCEDLGKELELWLSPPGRGDKDMAQVQTLYLACF